MLKMLDIQGFFLAGILKQQLSGFKTETELLTKLDYYLTNEKERVNIQTELCQKVRLEHSWDIRIKQLFNDFLS